MNGDIINLVAFDAEGTLIELVRDGTVAALVIQDPFKMGYDGIKTALAASRGEQMPRNIHTDATVITKANMNAPRPTERLNPLIADVVSGMHSAQSA